MSAATGVTLTRVCRLTGAPLHGLRQVGSKGKPVAPRRRGPRVVISDETLIELIREVIKGSPFSGEGHRKVTARCAASTGSGWDASACFG